MNGVSAFRHILVCRIGNSTEFPMRQNPPGDAHCARKEDVAFATALGAQRAAGGSLFLRTACMSGKRILQIWI